MMDISEMNLMFLKGTFVNIKSLNLGNKLCRMACPFNFCKNNFLRIGQLEKIRKACIKIPQLRTYMKIFKILIVIFLHLYKIYPGLY